MIFGQSKKTKRNMRQSFTGSKSSGRLAAVFAGLGAKSGKVDWGRVFMLLVAFSLLLVWLLLWSRFYVLQVVQGPEYANRAERQHKTGEVHVGRRGSILDRNGNVLAGSIESYSLSARPSEIEDLKAVTAFLARTLGQPESKLSATLKGKKGFVWVQRKISDRDAKLIAESGLPGLYLQKEQERVYPYKHLAGQLIGFVGLDNKGLDGLEAVFDNRLSGREVRQIVDRDARGGRMYRDGRQEIDELAGQDVQLTIDAQIQFFAENAIAKTVQENEAAWGGCLIVDVKSGDILAWAHYPFFNPNVYNQHSATDRRNKLAMDALEQGSTIKSFTVAAALQEHKITAQTVYNCENGKWTLRGKVIRDTRPHKELTVEQILRYSSNIGVGKIGLDMGAKTYGGYLQKLGFGTRTGLPLMGENPGIMRNPAKWPDTDLASSAFGQSFSATTLQMAQAYLCLANYGEKKPLQIVRNADLRQQPFAGETRVFSAETSAEVLRMLRSVVHEDDGGGRFARIPGMEVGGKTGTAQKAENGIYGEKRTASFAGFAPAQNPEVLVLVVVDEPLKNQYGASVAAPVFKQVTMETLAYAGRLPDPASAAITGLAAGNASTFDPTQYAQMKARQDAALKNRSASPVPGGSQGVGHNGTREVKGRLAQPGSLQADMPVVPDVRGMSMRQAIEIFAINGIMPQIQGQGEVVENQTPLPGSPWPAHGFNQQGAEAPQIVLWLKESAI